MQDTAVEAGSSSLQVSLHPLVLVNIGDHFTRFRVQTGQSSPPRVIGTLLGTQSGRNVEIFSSFELVYTEIEGQVVLDTDYLETKLAQYQKVFKNYDVLGWYSTGIDVLPGDMMVQKSLLSFNESPLYLVMDPVSLPQAGDIPVHIYESEIRIVDGEARDIFAKVPFRIETMEAERIAVDHAARVAPEKTSSELVTHIDGMYQAISMLFERINVIQRFLEATLEGKIPFDHGVVRQVTSLCHRLPALNTAAFNAEYIKEYEDGMLLAYLGMLTRGINTANELVSHINVIKRRAR